MAKIEFITKFLCNAKINIIWHLKNDGKNGLVTEKQINENGAKLKECVKDKFGPSVLNKLSKTNFRERPEQFVQSICIRIRRYRN